MILSFLINRSIVIRLQKEVYQKIIRKKIMRIIQWINFPIFKKHINNLTKMKLILHLMKLYLHFHYDSISYLSKTKLNHIISKFPRVGKMTKEVA